MEKKQTALDWHIEKRNRLEYEYSTKSIGISEYIERKKDIEVQAEQMEKEQNQLELPTDEEIYELAEKMLSVDYLSFTEGAKWMRDKIKGGQDETL
jgi:hypothetical protein